MFCYEIKVMQCITVFYLLDKKFSTEQSLTEYMAS